MVESCHPSGLYEIIKLQFLSDLHASTFGVHTNVYTQHNILASELAFATLHAGGALCPWDCRLQSSDITTLHKYIWVYPSGKKHIRIYGI
jgi:hypothetical protein